MQSLQQELDNTIKVLKSGGVILYPTETVWGLGCDATNKEAIKKIYKIKKREESKSLIILVANEHQLYKYVKEIPKIAYDLMEASEKPITIIYPNVIGIASNVIAKDGSAGIRITSNNFCNRLLQKYKAPIVSTSANIAGQEAPKKFGEINDEIKSQVDYIVNKQFDDNSSNKPSSIIKLEVNGEIKIIRN